MNEKLLDDVFKICNEPEENGYVEWLHKINQFERIQGLVRLFYDSSAETTKEEAEK